MRACSFSRFTEENEQVIPMTCSFRNPGTVCSGQKGGTLFSTLPVLYSGLSAVVGDFCCVIPGLELFSPDVRHNPFFRI